MRTGRREERPRQVIEPYVAWVTDYTCDGCGRTVSREDHGDGYAHELAVAVDSVECVSFYRRRDYCPACLDPIWRAINELIGADPGEERDRDYD